MSPGDDESDALKKAFPGRPLTDEQFRCLVCILYERMSQRAVARTLSDFLNADYYEIYNDVLGALSPGREPSYTQVERVRAQLRAAGYQHWSPRSPDADRDTTPRAELRDRVAQNMASVFDILLRAYPDEIPPGDYEGLLAILSRDDYPRMDAARFQEILEGFHGMKWIGGGPMNAAMIANVVCGLVQKDHPEVESDVRRVLESPPPEIDVERVRALIIAAGYPPPRTW